MKISVLRPDGFAIGLFAFGIIMLFVPMMVMPGLVAIMAALCYWVITVVVKATRRRT